MYTVKVLKTKCKRPVSFFLLLQIPSLSLFISRFSSQWNIHDPSEAKPKISTSKPSRCHTTNTCTTTAKNLTQAHTYTNPPFNGHFGPTSLSLTQKEPAKTVLFAALCMKRHRRSLASILSRFTGTVRGWRAQKGLFVGFCFGHGGGRCIASSLRGTGTPRVVCAGKTF